MKLLELGNPYLLQFNLIKRCIFNCEYCYLRDSPDTEISFADYKIFLDKWDKYSNKFGFGLDVNLMGGDLWLHKEVLKILEFTHGLRCVKHINLAVTNLWYEKGKQLLPTMKDKIALVQFKLDALEGRYDDIKFLEKNGILAGVKIVLSKQFNLKQKIDQVSRLNNAFPNLRVFVDRLCPTHPDELRYCLSLDELRETVMLLNNKFKYFRAHDPLVSTLLGLERGKMRKIKTNELGGCVIPTMGLTVFPDGKIKVCARIPAFDTGFTIHDFDLKKYLNKFAYIRTERERCKDCGFFLSCQGGCPATSFIKNNTFSRDFNCLRQMV